MGMVDLILNNGMLIRLPTRVPISIIITVPELRPIFLKAIPMNPKKNSIITIDNSTTSNVKYILGWGEYITFWDIYILIA
jgi:hypothetical protein